MFFVHTFTEASTFCIYFTFAGDHEILWRIMQAIPPYN